MSETATVYCLVDASGAPVYVGQTQLDISERTYNHWVCRTSSSLNRHNPMLASWLRTLPAAPKHEVLDVVRQSERLAVERYYITCFLWAGVPLLNRQQVPELLRVPVVSTDPVSRPSRSSIGWRGASFRIWTGPSRTRCTTWTREGEGDMTINQTPDPREQRLPAWARDRLMYLRREVRDLERTADTVKGEHKGSNVRLAGCANQKAVPLPKNAHVEFDSNWGKIVVGHDLNGRLRIQGDGAVILRMNAANALTVELGD